jgi:hypothetical protein
MSQVLTITNLTSSQVDLSVGIVGPYDVLTVTVDDVIPPDILSAAANKVISYTSGGDNDTGGATGPAGPTGATGASGPAGPTGPTGATG